MLRIERANIQPLIAIVIGGAPVNQVSGELGHCRHEPTRHRVHVARSRLTWPAFGQNRAIRPMSANADPESTSSGTRSTTNNGPILTKCRASSTDTNRIRPGIGKLWVDCDRRWADFRPRSSSSSYLYSSSSLQALETLKCRTVRRSRMRPCYKSPQVRCAPSLRRRPWASTSRVPNGGVFVPSPAATQAMATPRRQARLLPGTARNRAYTRNSFRCALPAASVQAPPGSAGGQRVLRFDVRSLTRRPGSPMPACPAPHPHDGGAPAEYQTSCHFGPI